MTDTIQEIFTDKIDDPINPMRSEMDRNALFELADNIKQNGLLNPITVWPVRAGGMGQCYPLDVDPTECTVAVHTRYEVVAGHRRLSACKIAGIIKINCVVRDLTDEQAFGVMTAENLERADVPLLDECRHYQTAIRLFGKSIAEVAKAARRSVGYIESRLVIAEMPDYMQAYLQSGDLKLGVALALVGITDIYIRRLWVDMAVRDGVSVAQAEYWLHGWKVNQLPGGTMSDTPPTDYAPDAAPIVMFECAIDGKKYDARLCKTLIVYEGNLPTFAAICAELNRAAPDVLDVDTGENNENVEIQ